MNAPVLPKSLADNPRLDQWLAFGRPDRVTVLTGKVELGQGILAALAQIAAEELDLRPDQVEVISGLTDRCPDEGFTAGSLSVTVGGGAVRLAAAEARALLLHAAGERLQADPARLSVDEGRILKDGQSTNLDYWSLAGSVDWSRQVSGEAPVKAPASYRVVGTSLPRPDFGTRLRGGGFIHDISLPGMRHARILRQPFRGAVLAEFDPERLARRHPEVHLLRRADFVALVAASEHEAGRALATARDLAVWQEAPGAWPGQEAPAPVRLSADGAGRAGANGRPGRTFSARYARPMIAHGSIAPSCALAWFEDGRLRVWTHSQGVFALRAQIARVLDLDPAAVTVIHAEGAGCYGHNAADDAAMDAAIVARFMPGAPVRVQWTREDELALAPLGAAQEAGIEAVLDDAGRIAAWRMDVLSMPQVQRPGAAGQVNLTSAEALDRRFLPRRCVELPEAQGGAASRNALALYDFAQDATVTLTTGSRIRTSSLRSLGAHLNVFAIESAMDELAELAGTDPLSFRLAHLSDERARAVLNEAVAMSGWRPDGPSGEGTGLGLAVARYKNRGAWLAAVAEVTAEEDVRLTRLWLAADVGLAINPDGVRNQIEGGAIQAASWTLKEQVPVEEDRVPPLDWERYTILRFPEIPEIETRLLAPAGTPPLGAGEAAQGPVAAAIGNAVARALGLRIRRLPITRDRIMEAAMAG